jgi:glyoxylate utilization-related uncharacterized protein
MDNHLIDFEQMDWVQPAKGIRYKAYVNGNQRMRLVEFSYGFNEEGYCLNGHAGYVLEGEFANDFNGRLEHFKKGDFCFIPKGEDDKHKAILKEGERALILLFELI